MYLAVLGREPDLSNAELMAIFGKIRQVSNNLSLFESNLAPDINRLGGVMKLAEKLEQKPLEFLMAMPEGKITIGVSDYSQGASKSSATLEAMKLKKILTRHGRSVRVVMGEGAVMKTATSLYNGLSGKNPKKCELLKVERDWYRVIGVQDIDAYSRRDQNRPARDARVGMLPPKLAQILINLCGVLPEGAVVLDPFCGTGVLLQEALLMGYSAYGTDLNERMVEFSRKNLEWLDDKVLKRKMVEGDLAKGDLTKRDFAKGGFEVSQGDATNFQWKQPIDAVASEVYLGKPMNRVPSAMELKEQKQICATTILDFLKNLASQIKAQTPVVIAVPAWLKEDGYYARLEILAKIQDMGYNVSNKTCEGLFYHREGQIVARDILILRKK